MSLAASRGSIKAILAGRGLVTLRPSDHIATGGEGSIYRVGSDTAVKIYSDPQEIQKLGIPSKIKELARLKSPYIVSPIDLALSEAKQPIGYHMPYVDGHPLSRVFTTDFWNRENFSIEHAKELVDRMRETVIFAHSQKAVMVDANELNWLVKFKGSNPEPRVVDVDSWAIGRWQAKVIMPSIRDWSAKSFDERSDWFSWGVVTFQVFTGLHPYKGTHPLFKKGEFIERMKKNASVFATNVRLNHAVRDFSLIPKPLLGWYESTFQKGERSIPPSPFDAAAQVSKPSAVLRVHTVGHAGLLVFERLYERTNDPIVRVFRSGAILLASGTLIDGYSRMEIANGVDRDSEVAKTPYGWLILEKKDGKAVLRYSQDGGGREETLQFSIETKSILGYENRLFVLGGSGLTEVKLHTFGKNVIASAGQTWNSLPNSTTLFEGVGVQDAMGAIFVVIPTGDIGLTHMRVRELDGSRVINGIGGHRFASLIAVLKNGDYQKFDIVFSKDYSSYRVAVSQVDEPGLNLAILPKGVNATIQEDGELMISVPSTGNATSVLDKGIKTTMKLGSFGDQVVYLDRGVLWSVRMK